MKKTIFSLFIGLLGIMAMSSCKSGSEHTKVLPPNEFEAKLAASQGALLVDVRTPEEFSAGSLPNAANIDYNAADFKDQMAKLDKTKPLFIFCKSGGRSGKAGVIIHELGFKEVYDMEGGYTAWSAAKH